MNPQDKLELTAKVQAIEVLLTNFIADFYVATATPLDAISERHDILRKLAREVTLSGVDPATSDLLAGSLQDAVEDLLEQIDTIVGIPSLGEHPR